MGKLKQAAVLALGLALLFSGCAEPAEETVAPPEPEESIYVPTGRDNPNVTKNDYQDDAFVKVGGFTIYTGGDAASHIGVDVSSHQQEIDWTQVAQSGVRFAMIRAGYRGYGESGGIYRDECFDANMQGALDAGLRTGVYFFSQATTPEEAKEEAKQTLEWLAGYDVTYPVVYDWESIPHAKARTDDVSPETVTQCVRAFCDEIRAAGYIPMVYFNQSQGYEIMNLEALEKEGYGFWLAEYAESPNFQYNFQIWQYSCTGTVPGVEGDVDLNLCLTDFQLDSWGIRISADKVTPTGLTLVCTQSGGEIEGELQTGSMFWLETDGEEGWTEVPKLAESTAWTSEAWSIPMRSSVKWMINWEAVYGALPAGAYRIGKEITDNTGEENCVSRSYYAEFVIE